MSISVSSTNVSSSIENADRICSGKSIAMTKPSSRGKSSFAEGNKHSEMHTKI